MKRTILSLISTLALVQMGCSKPGFTATDAASVSSAKTTTLATTGISLSGPEYGMARIPAIYTLAAPTGVLLNSATWNFGDGTAPVSGLGPISHTFAAAGNFTVSVAVVDSSGAPSSFSSPINVIPAFDGFECVTLLGVVGPSNGVVGTPISLAATVPTCVSSRMSAVVWNFGDNTGDNVLNTQHTFTAPGVYHVTVAISVIGAPVPNPMFTLTHDIMIVNVAQPPPVDPLACSATGLTRSSTGSDFTEDAKCGVNGHRTDTYHNFTVQTCTVNAGGESLSWIVSSVTKQLVSQGVCQAQSCELPTEAMTGVDAVAAGVSVVNGKYYLASGGHLNFFSSQSPAAACTTVQQARSCDNGVLGGDSSYIYLLCSNGCDGFGPNGTVKSGVVTGEVSVSKTCAFAETGFNDLFFQISDLTCNVGTVVTSNTRQGGLKTAAVCPTYQWTATESYGACSADCGGQQTLQYVCIDNKGAVASNDRCAGSAPVVARACDGNPDAVKRSDSVVTTDEAGSTNSCPANQIGVISRSRDQTVVTNYACIDHSVQQASQVISYGPYVDENYCRDYVAHRCSQDSLDNAHADGRYLWMVKCADKVPAIKEFLDKFATVHTLNDDYHAGGYTNAAGFGIGATGRVLYPTFMNRDGHNSQGVHCEQPWIAPTDVSASCDVPSTVYVAAVCLSSCATPEVQIMAKNDAKGSMKYVPFLEALTQKYAFVATLQSQSSMSSKRVEKTKVEQWVTELVDGDHVILEFSMKSGGTLRLTPNHPLLGSDAIMRQAGDYKVGDQLVKLGGIADEIVSINTTNYYGKVYNLFVKSADLHKNIVVTNGYLNGTAMYQNEGAKYMNTAIFRKNLTQGVFGK